MTVGTDSTVLAAEETSQRVPCWTFLPVHGEEGIVGWTLIDHDDLAAVSAKRLHRHRPGDGHDCVYFCEGIGHTRTRKIRLHRWLLGVTDPKIEVDHINHDRFDNRRSNLRVATRQQNGQNCSAHRDSVHSKHRGVDRVGNRWRARAVINYAEHHLGLFDTEEEAAEAARDFRAKHMSYATD